MVARESGGHLRAARAASGWGYTWVRWAEIMAASSASLSALDRAGPRGSAAPASDLGWRSAGRPVRKILVGMSRTGWRLRPEAERPPRAPVREGYAVKYMIMMFGGLGAATQDRSAEWIASMHELLMKLDTELKESGECVASDALVDPSQARTVRFTGGAPVPTDGPFAEVKESLAGYWIVEADEER